MNHTYRHFSKIALIVIMLVVVSIVIGISASWILIPSFLALDFATIMWLSKDSHRGGGRRTRLLPMGAMCLVPL